MNLKCRFARHRRIEASDAGDTAAMVVSSEVRTRSDLVRIDQPLL
jgi:hypothetical protein